MEIEAFRDVVIIVSGVIIILVAILLAVIAYIVYHKINRILNSTRTIATKVETLTTTVTDDIGKPLIQVAGIVQGIACGMRRIKRIFGKEE
jgi:hypothetical protein